MRGVTSLERDALRRDPRDLIWPGTPTYLAFDELTALGRLVSAVQIDAESPTGYSKSSTITVMGLLALRVCPVEE